MGKRMSNFRSTALATGNAINESAYDDVKTVADVIDSVVVLADILDSNVDFEVLAEVLTNLGNESAEKLAELATADLIEITDDLAKSSYLGNRKTDINLSYNMIGIDIDTEESAAEVIWNDPSKTVQYDYADILFVDNETIRVDFEFDNNPTTISTHADLLFQLGRNDTIDPVAQIDTVSSITPIDSTVYTVTINGIAYNYTSDADATVPEIIAGLIQEINVTQTNGVVPVTASDSGVNTILLTADVLGNPFTTSVGANLFTTTTTDNVVGGVAESAFLAKLEDTSIASFASPVVGEIIRAYDVIGASSNIERITMHAVSGSFKEESPIYFWGKTTSALETLAMRAGDIIALGNEIDNLILLSDSVDELLALQTRIPELIDTYTNDIPNGDITIYNKLTELMAIYDNLTGVIAVYNSITNVNTVATNIIDVNTAATNIAAIQEASANAGIATTQAGIATTQAGIATTQAGISTQQAVIATTKSNEIKAVTVGNTTTGAAGTLANVIYNPTSGEFTFVVPQGIQGDKGEAFQVNAVGLLTSRSIYDTQASGFSFLATDISEIYFKLSATSGDWSAGAPFGKGDTGLTGDTGNGIQDIQRTTGDGSQGTTDIYTITYTDAATSTFNVYNGADANIADTLVELISTWSSTKITAELALKANVADVPTSADPIFTGLITEQVSVSTLTLGATSSVQTHNAGSDFTLIDDLVEGEFVTFWLTNGGFTPTYPTTTWLNTAAEPVLGTTDKIFFEKIGAVLYGTHVGSVA